MPRINRAAQFAPFNALKGLNEALRMKEYEHEKIKAGDLSQEKIEEISKTLSSITKGDEIIVKYFRDGYYSNETGKCVVKFEEETIIVNNKTIKFDEIQDIFKK